MYIYIFVKEEKKDSTAPQIPAPFNHSWIASSFLPPKSLVLK